MTSEVLESYPYIPKPCHSYATCYNGIGGVLIFGITNDDTVVGLENAEHDAEIISEQIKVRLDPIPNFKLSFHKTEYGKKLILLDVYSGDETPYYYDGDGTKIAYHRVRNESVLADRAKLKELVMKGSATSYDSLKSKYKFENLAFTKLKSAYTERIATILFEGIKYGVFTTAQFDSWPELCLARVLERDAGVKKIQNWLRPAPLEFNITYNRGRQYEPDFVVEIEEQIFLVEVY